MDRFSWRNERNSVWTSRCQMDFGTVVANQLAVHTVGIFIGMVVGSVQTAHSEPTRGQLVDLDLVGASLWVSRRHPVNLPGFAEAIVVCHIPSRLRKSADRGGQGLYR